MLSIGVSTGHTNTCMQTWTGTDVQNHLHCMARLVFESQLMHEQTCNHANPSIKGSGAAKINMHTDTNPTYGNPYTHTHTLLYMQTDKTIFPRYTAFFSQTAPASETTQHVCLSTGWSYFWWSVLWKLAPKVWLPYSIAITVISPVLLYHLVRFFKSITIWTWFSLTVFNTCQRETFIEFHH